MPKTKLPFLPFESVPARAPVNMFFHPEGWKRLPAMLGTPGLKLRTDPGIVGEVRAIEIQSDGDFAVAIIKDKVVYIDKDWNYYTASQALGSTSGDIWLIPGYGQFFIVEGGRGWKVTWSGTTLTVTQVTDDGFLSPTCATFADNYFLIGVADTLGFQRSEANDCSSWDALKVGTAEAIPDEILAMTWDHRQLFLMGHVSGEVFYNSGNSTFNFERFPDIFIEDGIGAILSLTKADNSVFYVNQEGIPKRLDGFTPGAFGPAYFNDAISKFSTFSDARFYKFIDRGMLMLAMIFPSENKTYVYNFATKEVHQWSSGVAGGRHRGNCFVQFNGKTICGDYANGKIYSLEHDVYRDDTELIRWEYYSPVIQADGKNIFHQKLLLEFKTGVGLVSGQGSDPIIELSFSNDEMKSWPFTLQNKLGKLGEYDWGVLYNRLGSSPSRIYRLVGSDPVERTFRSVKFEYELGL